MDMDLFLLNKLSQLKDGNSGGGNASSMGAYLSNDASVNTDNDYAPIASIYASNCRASSPTETWSTTAPFGNFYTYNSDDPSKINRFFMAKERTSENLNARYHMHSDESGHDAVGGIQWSDGHAMGCAHWFPQHNYNSSYSPFLTRILFMKNTTASDIIWNPHVQFNSQWSSGHDGASHTYYVPNAANYSEVTSVQMVTNWQYTSSVWNTTASTGNVTIPARTTVAFVLQNSCNAWTSSYNIHWVWGHNIFYNLHQMPVGLRCDLKATLAYQTMRDTTSYSGSNGYTQADIVKFFNNIGTVYGDNVYE